MSVARHGVECRTRTFPTKCKNCGDDAFYFSCTCGLKVFFDELGWPEHCCEFSRSDQAWARSRPREKLANGGTRVTLSDGVTATRRPVQRDGWDIDPGVVAEARRKAQSRERNPIEAVPPGAEWSVEITGVITELRTRVDVYERLKLARTVMNRGFLDILGDGAWGRVTVHVLEEVTYSFTAWVRATELARERVKKGVGASARLRRLDVPGKAREWVCERFELV